MTFNAIDAFHTKQYKSVEKFFEPLNSLVKGMNDSYIRIRRINPVF